jgi:hypothetical protein
MEDETVYKAQAKAGLNRSLNLGRPAVLLVLGGVFLLLASLYGIPLHEILMPLVIIGGLGVLLLWPAHRATAERPSQFGFLAIPGAFFLAFGVMVSTLIMLNRLEAILYLWTFLPMAVMAGIMYWKRFEQESGVHEFGQKFIRAFFYLFLGLGLFFELLVFQSLGPWWPLVLVAAGLFLLWQERRGR